MTANSPRSVAESAGSTVDPDVQARRANDGELSAGCQSDLTIDEDAVEGLLTAEEFAAEFDENLDDGKWYAEYRRLAAEQAALRRLATLVARGVEPSEIFGAVADEMRRCLHAATAGLGRYETTGEITLLSVAAYLPDAAMKWPVGTRTPIEDNTLAAVLQRTGRPARMDIYDNATGTLPELVRAIGLRAAVGVPVIVDGRLWGLAAVGSDRPGPMPADTEVRIGRFAELTATALVAGHRDEQKRQLLAEASRRWNLAAESERRRIERDLHDGAQQHLVTLALYARAAEASAPAELAELKHQMSRIASGLAEVSMELQEISRGIRPAILAKGGLPTAIKELARRSPVPVRLDVAINDRLPEPIQTATYYLVAEALTNTAKHAHACTVHVQVDTDHTDAADPVLRISVRDDGRGGADPHGGSGLVGLTDRVDALGGRLWLHSPPGAGTTLRAEVPLRQAPPRLSLVDALLDGRAFDEWSLRDLAGHLRLPINGPFVVIAAHIPSAGDEPLPEIESKLRSLDTFSAWRRLPDMQVGITHVESDHKLDRVVALMSRMTTARVGVSAPFEDLRDTPRALHVARVMLRGPTDSTSSVAVFDGSILATAAVSAPEAMIKTIGEALDGFGDLPDEDRKMLFETFRVWQDNDASVRGAAELLTCHPNTVRHRLRRIEKRTGRSLSRPRDIAELCLAFEVHRRLM